MVRLRLVLLPLESLVGAILLLSPKLLNQFMSALYRFVLHGVDLANAAVQVVGLFLALLLNVEIVIVCHVLLVEEVARCVDFITAEVSLALLPRIVTNAHDAVKGTSQRVKWSLLEVNTGCHT